MRGEGLEVWGEGWRVTVWGVKGKELVTRGIVIRRVIAVVKKGKVKYRIRSASCEHYSRARPQYFFPFLNTMPFERRELYTFMFIYGCEYIRTVFLLKVSRIPDRKWRPLPAIFPTSILDVNFMLILPRGPDNGIFYSSQQSGWVEHFKMETQQFKKINICVFTVCYVRVNKALNRAGLEHFCWTLRQRDNVLMFMWRAKLWTFFAFSKFKMKFWHNASI